MSIRAILAHSVTTVAEEMTREFEEMRDEANGGAVRWPVLLTLLALLSGPTIGVSSFAVIKAYEAKETALEVAPDAWTGTQAREAHTAIRSAMNDKIKLVEARSLSNANALVQDLRGDLNATRELVITVNAKLDRLLQQNISRP